MSIRTRLKNIILNYERNGEQAQDNFNKTGDPGFREQMMGFFNKANELKKQVQETERVQTTYEVLVIGNGFVGSTIADAITPHFTKVHRIDPAHFPDRKIEDYPKATCAIVAVPTPENEDGSCDDSIVRQVIDEINSVCWNIPILLKSTVSPELLSQYPDNVTYNPEFLRANTAKEDFENQTTYILGSDHHFEKAFWLNFFEYANVNLEVVDRNTASMIKYMHNCWLATKVAFFHEVYSKVDMSTYEYSRMTKILGDMENIGPSHMDFNEENSLGFGGYCFPKDTKAFEHYTGSEILAQVIETNENLLKINEKSEKSS